MSEAQSLSVSRRATRLVWLLSALGVLGGVLVLVIFGLTLRQVRSARLEVDRTQTRLADLVTRSQSLLDEGEAQVSSHLSGRPSLEPERDWLLDLEDLIRESIDHTPDATIVGRLNLLNVRLEDLRRLRDDSHQWYEQETSVREALRETRTEVGSALHSLREAVVSSEGRMRLQRVLKVRRFRSASEEDARAAATEIIDELGVDTGLSSLKVELADLALLGEQLVNEDHVDGLTDLKDNRFTSTLARLRRELGKMAADDVPIESASIDAFEQALFGRDFVNDAAHQTIIPGEGGLYDACLSRVHLAEQRESLRSRGDSVFTSVRSIRQEVQEDAARLGTTLTERAEDRFTSAWRNVILVSVVIGALFCVLAALIARAIRNQMTLLADTTAELRKANKKMKGDLEAAAKVQQSLLPTAAPDVAGATFAWLYKPCDELAGDILNVIQLDPTHVAIYVADVSGHGVAASLLSFAISRMLTAEQSAASLVVRPTDDPARPHIMPPIEVATELNRRFPMAASGGKYFTLIYGVVDLESGEFTLVAAGHPPAIRQIPGRKPEVITLPGKAIGWMPDADFEQTTITLCPGERLCFYSDGVPEAMDPDRKQFGNARLIETLVDTRALPLQEGVRHLVSKVERWCGATGPMDDVTIVAMEIVALSAGAR